MNKRFAEKWAKALESGKYKQTRGRLYNGEGYCCLGVVCDLLGAKFKKNDSELWVVGRTQEYAVLPPSIKKKLNMKTANGVIKGFENSDGDEESLVSFNDHGKTFPQIAKIIRENYKAL